MLEIPGYQKGIEEHPASVEIVHERDSLERHLAEPEGLDRLRQRICEPGRLRRLMIHSRGANPPALRQAPLGAIPTPPNSLIRTDVTQPVFTFQSETDSRLPRQADSNVFRWWEMPGTAHVDTYLLKGLSTTDIGGTAEARALFDTMVHPFAGPFPIVGSCALGANAGPHHWVFQAALHHLNEWVTNGTLPLIGPRMNTTDGTGAGALVLDARGNVTGGIRTPHVDVPVATLRGTGNSPAVPGPLNFCALFGVTTPFTPETLAQLYRNHGAFVSQWVRSVNTAVAGGFILPTDAELVKDSGATSGIGK
jgi:hypothetical protein